MKYLVAVSGGVDSVVLLDMLSKSSHTIVVAHVDHGIRGDESAADARFVEKLAERYGFSYVSARFDLGEYASEERARNARYGFLSEQAEKSGATIVTAHHLEDAIETVAINLQRGTGWRGLAVMGGEKIARPLLSMTKQQIYDYAVRHRLEWVEDHTNASDAYQRNRIRRRLNLDLSVDARREVLRLRARQLQLRRDISWETDRILMSQNITRHFMTMLEQGTAVELLGSWLEREAGVRPTRPQLERTLLSIKTAKPRTTHQVGNGINLHTTSRNFFVNQV